MPNVTGNLVIIVLIMSQFTLIFALPLLLVALAGQMFLSANELAANY